MPQSKPAKPKRQAYTKAHVRIANRIMQALCAVNIRSREFRVFIALVNVTYGWSLTVAPFSAGIAAKATGLNRSDAWRAISVLLSRKMIFQQGAPSGSQSGFFGPNSETTEWIMDDATTVGGVTNASVGHVANTKRGKKSTLPPTVALVTLPTPPPDLANSSYPANTDEKGIIGIPTTIIRTTRSMDPPPPTHAHVVDEESWDYSPFARDKSGHKETRKKVYAATFAALTSVLTGDTEKHRKAMAEFILTPPLAGVDLRIWWKAFPFSMAQAAKEVDAEGCAYPVGVALSRWPGKFHALLKKHKPAEEPESERAVDQRWVIYPRGAMGPRMPEAQLWEQCYADELTDDQRQADKAAEQAWLKLCRARMDAEKAEALAKKQQRRTRP